MNFAHFLAPWYFAREMWRPSGGNPDAGIWKSVQIPGEELKPPSGYSGGGGARGVWAGDGPVPGW